MFSFLTVHFISQKSLNFLQLRKLSFASVGMNKNASRQSDLRPNLIPDISVWNSIFSGALISTDLIWNVAYLSSRGLNLDAACCLGFNVSNNIAANSENDSLTRTFWCSFHTSSVCCCLFAIFLFNQFRKNFEWD